VPRGVARLATRAARASFAVVLAVALAACGAPSGAPVSFDPSTACSSATDEGHFSGAYPDLEATLPTRYGDRAPDSLDSGRSCSPTTLGTLAERGITQMRYAGANWDLGNGVALTIAVFEADGLDPGRLIEFYHAGAQQAQRTNQLKVTDTTVGDAAARRLDVLFGTSTQTIVAWPARDGSHRVWALLASYLGDTKVAEELQTLAGSPGASPSPVVSGSASTTP
jgi:hypothetical protein